MLPTRVNLNARNSEAKTWFTGQRLYVNNNASAAGPGGVTGANTNHGMDADHPLATLAAAVALSVSARQDYIYIGAGHAETLASAAAIALSVSDLTIVGLGTRAPTFTWATSAAATMTVTAPGVTLENLKFVNAMDELVTMLSLSALADDFTMNNVKMDMAPIGGSVQAITGITITAAANDFSMNDCRIYAAADAATPGNAISAGALDGFRMRRCVIDKVGATTGGNILFTGNVTHAEFDDCHFANHVASATACIAFGATATYAAFRNCTFDLGTIATTGVGLAPVTGSASYWSMFECYVVNDQAEAGALVGTPSA